MKINIQILLLCVLIHTDLCSQQANEPPSPISSVVKIEAMLGATGSLAYGKFIDYHSTFNDVVEQGTVFNGHVYPQMAPTFGLQTRVLPFKDGKLRALSFSIGMQYQQRGFRHHYNTTYTPTEATYTDLTKYVESYRHHYLAVPLQARWGKKWFGVLGFTINRHFDSGFKQKLVRELTGPDAVGGGFHSRSTNKRPISNAIINRSFASIQLGGGFQWNERNAIAVRAGAGGKILKNVATNYRTLLVELAYYQTLSF